MAHRIVGNPPTSHGEIKGNEIVQSQRMLHSAATESAGFRNQLQISKVKAPGLWGYNPTDAHQWLKPRARFTNGKQDQKVPWVKANTTPVGQEITPDKQGLAMMSTKDPQDHKFDKRYWYGKHYANMQKAGNLGTHGEDLGKQLLTSDFFAYLERKKELEFEKEYAS